MNASGLLKTASLSLLLTVALAAAGLAQTAALPCQSNPEVGEALQKLPDDAEPRRVAIRALVERFPNEVIVHQTYQDSLKYDPTGRGPEAVLKEYQALPEKYPGDPMYAYLAARALIGYKTKEAIPQLEKLADYPWSHVALASVYSAPNFKNLEKLREHLDAFMKACPLSLAPYSYLRSLEASDFVKQAAQRLRSLIQDRTDTEAAGSYPVLWALEFRVRPMADHGELRKQVTEDVKRLRAAYDAAKRWNYIYALQEGYKLAGDTENAKWAEAEMRQAAPPSNRGYYALMEWDKKNPRPELADPPEKLAQYEADRLKSITGFAREFPDDLIIQLERVGTLRSAEKSDPAEVEAAGEALLRAKEKSSVITSYSHSLRVAELYSEKGVRLDRVPQLVEQASQEIEKPSRGFASDLYTRETPDDTFYQTSTKIRNWCTVARIWLKVMDKERARAMLLKVDSELRKLDPGERPDAKERDPEGAKQRQYASVRGSYWQAMAELALLEEHKMDALTFYQNALLMRPAPAPDAPAPRKDELAEKARALWKEFGGTNEGWQAWFTLRPGARLPARSGLYWNRVELRVPEFQIADQNGKKWTLASLKGKTVMMNVWASW